MPLIESSIEVSYLRTTKNENSAKVKLNRTGHTKYAVKRTSVALTITFECVKVTHICKEGYGHFVRALMILQNKALMSDPFLVTLRAPCSAN